MNPSRCRSHPDPERSLRLPQSCRSGTQGFHEFRCSEAAVRDLTHPAITGRWRSGQDFPRWIVLSDRFTAANLNLALARPGQQLPVVVTFALQAVGPWLCSSSGMARGYLS